MAGLTHALVKAVANRKRSAHSALDENIETIKNWERASVHHRSPAERVSDEITRIAASGKMLVFHVGWFTFWVLANVGLIPGLKPFDPFPFQFLTMVVSLEAIFLSLFVLASQNRLTAQADKRSNLDLQIDLLAEREMTAVLRLLQDIARHLDVRPSLTSDQISDLVKQTDIETLTYRMEELADNALPAAEKHSKPASPAKEDDPRPATRGHRRSTPAGKPSGK
jgi:uncharacterized membrane protein